MTPCFVYILFCNDQSYYTGITNDLERRLGEHKSCFYPNAYTATRLPVKLIFWEKFQTRNQAIQFERQVKGWSRKKKEAIVAGDWERLKELSVCMNFSHCKNIRQSPFDSAQGDK